MTQTIESAVESNEFPAISLAEALIQRTETATPPASEESATDAPEKAVTAEESATEALENDAAPDGEAPDGRLSRSDVRAIKAENETLKLTQAEFDQRVQDLMREKEEAAALAAQLQEADAKRRADFETYAGTPEEFLEAETVAKEVGIKTSLDRYYQPTDEEIAKVQRYTELLPRNQYQDLITERALNAFTNQMADAYTRAVKSCPGVDPQKLAPLDDFADINRHFYEAGAASKQSRIDELEAQLKGLATKANSAARTPAVGGASGSPPGGDDRRSMSLGEALQARIAAQESQG